MLMENKLCLVVPCFNEAKRLPVEQFLKKTTFDILFVDDASQDDTLSVVNSLANRNSHISCLSLEQNSGKAEAVRSGLLEAFKKNYEWVGFVDADLSTPLDEIDFFFRYDQEFYSGRSDVIIASRIKRAGSTIVRKASRHYLGRVILTICSLLVPDLEVYDTQCGAKVFKVSPVLKNAFLERFHTNWLFDVELIMRLRRRHLMIIEYPLRAWRDVGGSKVFGVSNYLSILSDLIWIAFNLRS